MPIIRKFHKQTFSDVVEDAFVENHGVVVAERSPIVVVVMMGFVS